MGLCGSFTPGPAMFDTTESRRMENGKRNDLFIAESLTSSAILRQSPKEPDPQVFPGG